jgi:hypothetical protein
MVSAKLVRHIEEHWEAVGQRWLRLLRAQKDLHFLSCVPESEVYEISGRLLRNLGRWLASSGDNELARQYEEIGRMRCRDKMPASEAVRGVQLLREAAIGYIRDQGFFDSSLDLYAEEELEHDLSRFFDLLMYHLLRGYEQQHAAHLTVVAVV